MQLVRDEGTGADLLLARRLGEGVEGVVYLARDGRAVKLVPAADDSDPRPHKVRLFIELVAAGRLPATGLSWPRGVVTDRATGRWAGFWMDHAPGRPLLAMLEDRSLGAVSLRVRVTAGAKLAATLAALHAATAVDLHQIGMPDLAARNVLWDVPTGEVTVIDMDSLSCRVRGPRGMLDDPGTARTPGSSPPEMLADPPARADRHTDLFALATVLFELITGRSPTDVQPGPGVTPPDPDDAVRDGCFPLYTGGTFAPPTYAVDPAAVPDELHGYWIRAFLESRDRRPTASEWEAAFRRWAVALTPARRRCHRRALVAAAAVSVAAIGGAVWSAASRAALTPVWFQTSTQPDAVPTDPRPTKRLGNDLWAEVIK